MAIKFLLFTLVSIVTGPLLAIDHSLQVRALLAQSPRLSESSLSTLFNVGDDRIEDLLLALDDEDEVVRRNAQVVIRYLGNEVGMNRLLNQYARSATNYLSGPVPLPLRDWDYRYIREFYVKGSSGWDSRATSYIYALALDGSRSATALLNELNSGKNNPVRHFALDRVMRSAGGFAKPMNGKLPDALLDNAFFLDPEDREQASARVLSYNYSRSKCLIVVWAGSIPAAETYHVVLQRDTRWKFFSITQVAAS